MIGYRIKRLRKERGLTQDDLGRGILSVSYISRIENNVTEPPVDVLPEIAKRLGVSVHELLGVRDKERKERISGVLTEALEYLYQKKLPMVVQLLNNVREEILEIFDERLHIEFLILEMMYYIRMDELNLVEERKKHLSNLPLAEYPFLLFRYLRVIGSVYYSQALFVKSIYTYQEALNLPITVNEIPLEFAYLYFNLSLSYVEYSDTEKSLYYITKANEIFQELGMWYELGESSLVIGYIHFKKQEWDKAIENYKKVLNLTKQTKDILLELKAYHNMGLVYQRLQNLNLAQDYWSKSLVLSEEVDHKRDRALTLFKLAESYWNQQNEDRFIYFHQKLHNTLENCKYPFVEAKSNCLLAKYYYVKSNKKKYKDLYLKAIHIFAESAYYLSAAELCYELAEELDELSLYKRSASLYYLHHSFLKEI